MFLKCLYLTLLHSCPASISPFFVMLHNSFCYGPPKYFSSMEYNFFFDIDLLEIRVYRSWVGTAAGSRAGHPSFSSSSSLRCSWRTLTRNRLIMPYLSVQNVLLTMVAHAQLIVALKKILINSASAEIPSDMRNWYCTLTVHSTQAYLFLIINVFTPINIKAGGLNLYIDLEKGLIE